MSRRQRPEIGDHHTRKMAAKTAFLLANYQSRVSEDWVVGTAGIEPVTPTLSRQPSGKVRLRPHGMAFRRQCSIFPARMPITAKICRQACDTVLTEHPGESAQVF